MRNKAEFRIRFRGAELAAGRRIAVPTGPQLRMRKMTQRYFGKGRCESNSSEQIDLAFTY